MIAYKKPGLIHFEFQIFPEFLISYIQFRMLFLLLFPRFQEHPFFFFLAALMSIQVFTHSLIMSDFFDVRKAFKWIIEDKGLS